MELFDIDVVNNRVIINSIKPPDDLRARRGARNTGYLVWHEAGRACRTDRRCLGMDRAALRIRTGDVGGSFGFGYLHPEQLVIAWAARRLAAGCAGNRRALTVSCPIFMVVTTAPRRAP